jgi:RHS repeat-associated protein
MELSGNVLNTGNTYLYDAEGRICAVKNLTVGVMTGYIYDADGTRVAKGTISQFTCDYNPADTYNPSTNTGFNGFQITNDYILGPVGEQVTELAMGGTTNGSTSSGMVWQHTNVWAAGKLLATYDGGNGSGTGNSTYGLHFYLDDPLGTRRVQTDYAGVVEQTCQSLPYGEGETCAITPTEHLFTGKERDTESGNDYFGARYYASSMGRWMSPDRLNLTDDRVLNPANTLNKYVYGGNNPLKYTDPDGKDITVFYENSFLSPPGHIMFLAENQQTGDAAAMSWGPVHDSEYGFTALGSPVNSTKTFGFSQTTDELKAQYSSLTIETSPEDAQEIISFIRQLSTSTNPYTLYGSGATNCTTVCRNALKAMGILPSGDKSWTPAGLWGDLFARYSPSYWMNPFAEFFPKRGADYGNRPSNYDPFDLMSLLMNSNSDNSSVRTEQGPGTVNCGGNSGVPCPQ